MKDQNLQVVYFKACSCFNKVGYMSQNEPQQGNVMSNFPDESQKRFIEALNKLETRQ